MVRRVVLDQLDEVKDFSNYRLVERIFQGFPTSKRKCSVKETPDGKRWLYLLIRFSSGGGYNNHGDILSPCISQLKNDLIFLDLRGTNLCSLPASIGQLEHLKDLNLTLCRHLSKLPHEVEHLVRLKTLTLQSSGIATLPTSFGGLTSLKRLNLSNTPLLDALPEAPSIWDNLISLEDLDLSFSTDFSSVPGSGMKELPTSLGGLKGLKRLNLSNWAKLESLPASIGDDLVSLEDLDLSFCTNLKILPISMGRFPNLHTVNLSVSGIWKEIVGLRDLVNVSLRDLANVYHRSSSSQVEKPGNLRVLYELASRRARVRMGVAATTATHRNRNRTDAEANTQPTKPWIRTMPSLWPRVLCHASRGFRLLVDQKGDPDPRGEHLIPQHDAIYRLLVDCRGSFVGAIIGLDGLPILPNQATDRIDE